MALENPIAAGERAIPMASFRSHMREVLEAVQRTHQRVTVTRNGEEAAVLIAPADLESLLETIEVLSDQELLQDLKASAEDVAAGRTHSLDEVMREYLQR